MNMASRKNRDDLEGKPPSDVLLPENWDEMPAEHDFDLTDEPSEPIPIAGRIVRIIENTVWVDAGRKNELPISLDEWKGEVPPKVGDVFAGTLLPDDAEEIVLGRSDPMPRSYRRVVEQFKAIRVGEAHSATLIRRIDKGFLIRLENDFNAYLPDESAPDFANQPNSLVGQQITCEIVAIDHAKRSIIVKLVKSATN